jgi:hypothetical protein
MESSGQNERCVFIVRQPDTRSYRFNVVRSGTSNSSSAGLLFTSLRRFTLTDPILEQRISRGGQEDFNITGNVVIITFYTREEPIEGFHLEYESHELADDINNLSRDLVLSASPEASLKHPEGEDADYHNLELSTFIYSPDFKFNPDKVINAVYNRAGLETCNDSVYVYKMETTVDSNGRDVVWKLNHKICNGEQVRHISHDDMLLFVFDSSVLTPGKGFNVTFEQVPKTKLHSLY